MERTSYEAGDVAAELRRRLPGVGAKKLHKLLYFCQGRHLADTGTPLFQTSIGAWDMGPVVGQLWKHEQTNGPVTRGRPLDQGSLNSVGFVVSRYSRLTGRDLEVLTHEERPWQEARRRGAATGDRSPKIFADDLREYFASQDDLDDEFETVPPDVLHMYLHGARERAADPVRADDLTALEQRLAGLARSTQ